VSSRTTSNPIPMKLFLTGFTQTFLVILSTYFVVQKSVLGVITVGFFISLIWTFNVKKVVIGTLQERIIYSLGASSGSGIALLLSIHFLSWYDNVIKITQSLIYSITN